MRLAPLSAAGFGAAVSRLQLDAPTVEALLVDGGSRSVLMLIHTGAAVNRAALVLDCRNVRALRLPPGEVVPQVRDGGEGVMMTFGDSFSPDRGLECGSAFYGLLSQDELDSVRVGTGISEELIYDELAHMLPPCPSDSSCTTSITDGAELERILSFVDWEQARLVFALGSATTRLSRCRALSGAGITNLLIALSSGSPKQPLVILELHGVEHFDVPLDRPKVSAEAILGWECRLRLTDGPHARSVAARHLHVWLPRPAERDKIMALIDDHAASLRFVLADEPRRM